MISVPKPAFINKDGIPSFGLLSVREEEAAFDRIVAMKDSPIVSAEEYREWWPDDVDEPQDFFTWDLAVEKLGKHLEVYSQAIGDCVSHGCANVVENRSLYECFHLHQEEKFRRVFPPYIYWQSRCAEDCGRGQLGSSDGSTGIWGAVALANHGVLFSDDDRCPAYSGSVASSWGRCQGPAWAEELAADNLMGKTARLTKWEEIRHELINFRPPTIASMRGWTMDAEVIQGIGVLKPSGSWAHQTCFIAWRDDPFPCAYRLNSWGPNAHRNGNVAGEQPGGGWWRAEDLERELRGGGVEVYAMSAFQGHPGREDPGIVGQEKPE